MLQRALPIVSAIAGLALVSSGARAQLMSGGVSGVGGAPAVSVGIHSPVLPVANLNGMSTTNVGSVPFFGFGGNVGTFQPLNNVQAFSAAPFGVFPTAPGTGYQTVTPMNNFINNGVAPVNTLFTGGVVPMNNFVTNGVTPTNALTAGSAVPMNNFVNTGLTPINTLTTGGVVPMNNIVGTQTIRATRTAVPAVRSVVPVVRTVAPTNVRGIVPLNGIVPTAPGIVPTAPGIVPAGFSAPTRGGWYPGVPPPPAPGSGMTVIQNGVAAPTMGGWYPGYPPPPAPGSGMTVIQGF